MRGLGDEERGVRVLRGAKWNLFRSKFVFLFKFRSAFVDCRKGGIQPNCFSLIYEIDVCPLEDFRVHSLIYEIDRCLSLVP